MRGLIVFFVRRIKHDPKYNLDPAMPLSAIIAMVWNTGIKLARGMRRRIGFKRAKGLTFIGSHVTLRNKGFISAGRNFIAEDYCEIFGLSRRGITFGDRVTVGRYAMIRPTRQYGGGSLGEGLRVGNNSNIGPFAYVGCSGYIQIGSDVMMGPRVSLYAENHNFEDVTRTMKSQGVKRETIVIEDDCWLGSHSVILAGVRIGRGSIIAAGSVVSRDVPPYSIAGGVPAKVIRSRLPEDDAAIIASNFAAEHTEHSARQHAPEFADDAISRQATAPVAAVPSTAPVEVLQQTAPIPAVTVSSTAPLATVHPTAPLAVTQPTTRDTLPLNAVTTPLPAWSSEPSLPQEPHTPTSSAPDADPDSIPTRPRLATPASSRPGVEQTLQLQPSLETRESIEPPANGAVSMSAWRQARTGEYGAYRGNDYQDRSPEQEPSNSFVDGHNEQD